MASEHDEGKGLVKVYWPDIRKWVAKVEPNFVEIVDELDPDKTFPLYLAYYPYGELVGDTETTFIPKAEGGHYRLNDPAAPKDVITHLGYGKNSAPFGMLLDKRIEIYIDLKREQIAVPWTIYSPGSFVSVLRTINRKHTRIYTPNGVLTAASGARSAFLLPNIGCSKQHSNLQRDFNIQSPPAKSLYDHWYLFKEILNSELVNCSWRSCLMFFSEKWVNKINNDKKWSKVKVYLHDFVWHQFQYERNRILYDIVFSVIQQKRNLKPNPYLADTARHLFATALGAAPGYVPACNNDGLPLDLLQNIFLKSYGLKKYFPTIMQPMHFHFEKEKLPVYYSLQNPSTFIFSPKSRQASSTLFEMRELEHIMRIFINELSSNNAICSDTVLGDVAKKLDFMYFHNEIDRHRIIKNTEIISELDPRYGFMADNNRTPGARFSADAKFLRGCVGIKTKD